MTGHLPMPGNNIDTYKTVDAATGFGQGCRFYFPPEDDVPGAGWPAKMLPPIALFSIVSIRPPVSAVIAGQRDDALEAFARTVPDDQAVTLWAEGDGARFGYEPHELLAMHAHASRIMRDANPALRYVQVVESYNAMPYSPNYPLTGWIAHHMDLICIDLYPDHASETPAVILANCEEQIRAAGVTAALAITETNSRFDRAAWIDLAWQRAKAMHYRLFWTYFGTTADNYPWQPADTETTAILRGIEREYRQWPA